MADCGHLLVTSHDGTLLDEQEHLMLPQLPCSYLAHYSHFLFSCLSRQESQKQQLVYSESVAVDEKFRCLKYLETLQKPSRKMLSPSDTALRDRSSFYISN